MTKRTLIFICLLFTTISLHAAKWENMDIDQSQFNKLNHFKNIKTFKLVHKKKSEYFINSLKQLTYRTFWGNIITKTVDIDKTNIDDLSFIIDREFQQISVDDVRSYFKYSHISYYYGFHQEKERDCINLYFFDEVNSEVALYYECQ